MSVSSASIFLLESYRNLSARMFDRGECNYQGLFDGEIPTFESNMVFTLRFMIDTKVRNYSIKPASVKEMLLTLLWKGCGNELD